MHTLIWGNQQPAWIEALPPAEQLDEIKEWFAAVAARYPDIDFIDVVNEPLHDPPAAPGNGNYIEALGGTGATGWDWIIESFRLARQYFPNAQLGINEFSVTNNPTDMRRYIGHHQPAAGGGPDRHGRRAGTRVLDARPDGDARAAKLDAARPPGLPIYVTELDIDGPTDEVQLADYQRIFPVFWEHPACAASRCGATGPATGARRRAPTSCSTTAPSGRRWCGCIGLRARHAVLRPWITANPASLAATVGDSVTLHLRRRRQRAAGVPVAQGRRCHRRATRRRRRRRWCSNGITTADAGSYDCIGVERRRLGDERSAALTVAKALAQVTLSGLRRRPTTARRASSPARRCAGGPGRRHHLQRQPDAADAPGSYAIVGTIVDANYVGLGDRNAGGVGAVRLARMRRR